MRKRIGPVRSEDPDESAAGAVVFANARNGVALAGGPFAGHHNVAVGPDGEVKRAQLRIFDQARRDEMAISIEYLDGVFADARGARTRRQEDAIIGSESKPPREGNDLWTKVRTPPPGSSVSPGAGATVRHGRQYRTGDSSTHGGTKQLKLGIRHATSNIGWVLFDTTSRDCDGPLAYSTHHQHRYGHHGSPGTPERLPSRPTRVGDILSSCPMVRTMPISAAATT